MKQLARERLVELGAQTPYRNFHHVRVAVEVHVPNEFGEHRARHDFTTVAQQHGQQRVLLRREIQSRAGAKRSSTYGVQFQISERHAVGFVVRTRGTASQHGLDACQQFGKDEGFDQIVVGARAQTAHPVFHAVRRGQHDHRRVLVLPERLQQREAVRARQHHVQENEVVVALDRHVAPVDAIGRDIDDVAALREPPAKMARELGVVFDDEDSHGMPQRSA